MINNLPKDLKNYIFDYLSGLDVLFLNKNYFERNNKILNLLRDNRYIFFILRKDFDFIFIRILERKKFSWIFDFVNETNFSYRNIKYLSFLEFMVDYSMFNNSTKCIKLLKNLISDDMKIKRHKRKPIISFNT
tara:strand:- start:4477 stop:4875 length:399 start_codon:yes stop_codon:yes gene_type:complete